MVFSQLIENSNNVVEVINKKPPLEKDEPYVLGIGDQIALIQVNEQNSKSPNLNNNQNGISNDENIRALAAIERLSGEKDVIQTTGRIGSDGSVLLLEVGRLDAVGKTINDLRSEVRNILIRNGISPKFQLEITAFNSQKAYLTINSADLAERSNSSTEARGVIKLTDQPLTLREVLSNSGVAQGPKNPKIVRLHRSSSIFSFELNKIYASGAKEITLKDRDHIFVDEITSVISRTEAIIAQDGSVLLPNLGKIKVVGKTVKEIETLITSLPNKNSHLWNKIQVQVIDFNSKRVILSIPRPENETEVPSKVIILKDNQLRLDELLTENGVTIQQNKLTKIYLQRNGKTNSFLLSDLLLDPTKKIYITAGDRIRVKQLSYKKNRVFIMGSGLTPKILFISPDNRETLADALFTPNGALSSTSAKRSDIYLLRGRDPVTLSHLDALNPSRLLVAEAMELRPNDIIFVSEQPIISFNRTLQTLFPLRILLRDIDNQNIP